MRASIRPRAWRSRRLRNHSRRQRFGGSPSRAECIPRDTVQAMDLRERPVSAVSRPMITSHAPLRLPERRPRESSGEAVVRARMAAIIGGAASWKDGDFSSMGILPRVKGCFRRPSLCSLRHQRPAAFISRGRTNLQAFPQEHSLLGFHFLESQKEGRHDQTHAGNPIQGGQQTILEASRDPV